MLLIHAWMCCYNSRALMLLAYTLVHLSICSFPSAHLLLSVGAAHLFTDAGSPFQSVDAVHLSTFSVHLFTCSCVLVPFICS